MADVFQNASRVVSNLTYHRLVLIGQLAAQQLFFQDDFLELTKQISIQKANGYDIPEDMDRALFQVECNLNQLMTNAAYLVAMLTELGIIKTREQLDAEGFELDPEPPTPPTKPTFKVVK